MYGFCDEPTWRSAAAGPDHQRLQRFYGKKSPKAKRQAYPVVRVCRFFNGGEFPCSIARNGGGYKNAIGFASENHAKAMRGRLRPTGSTNV
jgi:hypothetical protein